MGRIEGLPDTITFEGRSLGELRKAFQQAIETYEATQSDKGGKRYGGKFLLRLPPDLHRRVALAAQASGKSLNTWIADQLARVVEERPDPVSIEMLAPDRKMSIEEMIALLEKVGGKRGKTATPGHENYETARELEFALCRCSFQDRADYGGYDYIARTPQGACFYVGINSRNQISCGPKGYHFYKKVPPCI